MKIKQTTARSLAFLGAAINQGQTVKGVEHGPSLFRQAGLFQHLQNNFNVDVKDYGDVSLRPE
jgi:arginase family enzyme